jgi:hypothetical protein
MQLSSSCRHQKRAKCSTRLRRRLRALLHNRGRSAARHSELTRARRRRNCRALAAGERPGRLLEQPTEPDHQRCRSNADG